MDRRADLRAALAAAHAHDGLAVNRIADVEDGHLRTVI
jgi:hypothetical protein